MCSVEHLPGNPVSNRAVGNALVVFKLDKVKALPAVNVVWFKRDLRLRDHAALTEACQQSLPILPVYCMEPGLLDDVHYSLRHWRFIWQSIADLNEQLPHWVRRCRLSMPRPPTAWS